MYTLFIFTFLLQYVLTIIFVIYINVNLDTKSCKISIAFYEYGNKFDEF